ncbi:MAG TPA: GNAT family N-acetyltransferase [Pyrinomonadaceae bacterium]|nr:GNAT family N-acetyltransferase [Pyrinomonadaceae bacterium]
MNSSAIIEQFKPSDKPNLLAFLSKAYPDNPRQSDEAFWNWHFPGSPYWNTDDPPFWLAKVDGQIAGQLGAVPVELNVAGVAQQAIWILDLIVDPDFRRRGIAKKLALASMDHCPFVLGVNTPKQHAPKMLVGLGWTIFAKIPRYQKILFPGNASRDIAKFKAVASAVNAAFAPIRTGYPTWPNVKRVESFDRSFDELWAEARGQWKCSVSRSSQMLDWQFCRQPGKKFEILACEENGRLRGYVVMFFRKPNQYGVIEKVAITDICYAPEAADETITMLLDEAAKLAIERKVGSIVTDAIDERVERLLKHAGFWKVKSDLQLLAKVPEDQQIVYNAENWYLTRADSDISIFEAPNM